MYFHVIGIKEGKNIQYNIDIILQSDSESFIKDFLHSHHIVLLNFSEYIDSVEAFGDMYLVFGHKSQKIKAISYLDDISSAAQQFILM